MEHRQGDDSPRKETCTPQKEKKKTKKCLNSSCLVAFVVLRIFAVGPSAAAKRTVLKESSWPGRPEAIVPHSMDLSGFVLFSLVAAPLLSRWPTIQWIPPVCSTREGGTSSEFTSINTTGCVCSATNPSNNTQSCTQQPTCSPKRCFCPATDKFLSVSTPFFLDVFNKILSNHWKRWIPHQILEGLATLSAFFLSRIKRQRTFQSSDRHFQANYHFPLFSDPKKKKCRDIFRKKVGGGGALISPHLPKSLMTFSSGILWFEFCLNKKEGNRCRWFDQFDGTTGALLIWLRRPLLSSKWNVGQSPRRLTRPADSSLSCSLGGRCVNDVSVCAADDFTGCSLAACCQRWPADQSLLSTVPHVLRVHLFLMIGPVLPPHKKPGRADALSPIDLLVGAPHYCHLRYIRSKVRSLTDFDLKNFR